MSDDVSKAQPPLEQVLPVWADGKVSLKDIKGYTDHELYAIAHMAYFYLKQGKTDEAKTLFEGLVALDPKNGYYYRALGVIFYKLGESERALRQFGYAIRVAPQLPHAYVNRAEVNIALGRGPRAAKDLTQALSLMGTKSSHLRQKAQALLASLTPA